MGPADDARLTPDLLVSYFLAGARAPAQWRVGMELEKMGRLAASGRPLPYDGEGPTVRAVLETLHELRGGMPLTERGAIIGIEAPWGSITLEPGGQVEWSSAPRRNLAELEQDLDDHLQAMDRTAERLGIAWLDVAVEPELPLDEIPWMPKARYRIMREYFRSRGRLAHRMMTQTASIQCAFDFADADDWARKFRAAAYLSPVATALFANSSRIDGADSGYRSYRAAIWRETDDDRCGLPAIVFDAGFGIERWVDWVLDVPMLFQRSGDGLAPPDGSSFRQRIEGAEGERLTLEDWSTHCSSIFTEVRSYTYLEVRSADLQPADRALAVPAFWTGLFYDDDALEEALDCGAPFSEPRYWAEAMEAAARDGLEATISGRSLRETTQRAFSAAIRGLRRGDCVGDLDRVLEPLDRLARHTGLELPA